jgi:sarcosine oxidase subunit delta
MLLITCPWCGPRAEIEFTYGGQADIRRPTPAADASDAAWADYVFMRDNPRGLAREQWVHANGCRRWFKVERDTVSYAITGTSRFRLGHERSEGGNHK